MLNGKKGTQRWLKLIQRVPLIKKPELLNDILKETKFSLRVSKRPFDRLKALSGVEGPFDRLKALSGVEGLKRKRNSHSKSDIGFFIRFYNNLRSGATSLFDVRCSMFDVGRSSLLEFSISPHLRLPRQSLNLIKV